MDGRDSFAQSERLVSFSVENDTGYFLVCLRACPSKFMLERFNALPLRSSGAKCRISIAGTDALRYLKILADDLTGAADTTARCRRYGLPATIFLDIPEPPLPPGALAFTSDSRHLPAEEAARQARNTAARLPPLNAQWYKKIDSTLRGNIGSELDALLELLDAPAAVVCPAFPAQERGLHNGFLVASDHALPIALRQEAIPMESAPRPPVHLPTLLQEQSRQPVAALSLAEVRGGVLANSMKRAASKLDGCAPNGRIVLVVDALTEDDLDIVLQAQWEALPDALLCGSAGLAGALARRVRAQPDFPTAPAARGANVWDAGQGRSVLLVVGSGSESAHRQIDFLLSSASNEQAEGLRRHSHAPRPPVSRMIVSPETGAEATAALDPAQPIWLLQQPKPRPDAVLEGGHARLRADHLARISAAAFARRPPDLLVLAGGDTAMRILMRLEVKQLSVVRELLPGMPLCSAIIGGRQRLVVIKPGNFGGDETLLTLLTGGERAQL